MSIFLSSFCGSILLKDILYEDQHFKFFNFNSISYLRVIKLKKQISIFRVIKIEISIKDKIFLFKKRIRQSLKLLMEQRDMQIQPLKSPITTPCFKVKKMLSQSSLNQQKGMLSQQEKQKVRPIQLCSVKEIYQIINHKRKSGIYEYKPPRYQSQEKNIISNIRKNNHKENSKIFNSGHSNSIFLHKNAKGVISKFELLTQFIKTKEKSKTHQPDPGQYDSKIRSHTVSFNLKKQTNKKPYLDIIQVNPKKYPTPSPSEYKITGQFDKVFILPKSDSQNTLCKRNKFLQIKSLQRVNYFDSACGLTNQCPGGGQYKESYQQMPKIMQKNQNWYFKKQTIVENRFKSPDLQKIQMNRKIQAPGLSQYKPNPQIKLFSHFPVKNKLKIDQRKLKNLEKLKIQSKVGKRKQNIGPGDYLGLCQWNAQGYHKGLNQFKILHKRNPQSVYNN